MILFHGSHLEIPHIDLGYCNPYKDFGRGFYLTSLKEQAHEWAVKVAKRKSNVVPILNIYEFHENVSDLNSLVFHAPDSEWAQFIINNRNRDFKDFQNRLSNHDNKYDLVHGFVANDDISVILETFLLGILPMSELSHALIYKKLNDQYSFHTAKALTYLKFIGSEKL